ncbi:MAG: hypothetical protein H0U23_11915 [Blastocatellia bacterium]|jgi:hypothetical protein|nr:hypothetical protein [Blastocatellia bacterium]
MNFSQTAARLFAALTLLHTAAAPAQILSPGPVTGGVTATEAKVFVRTDCRRQRRPPLRHRPRAPRRDRHRQHGDDAPADFTAFIPLTGLLPETTYYLNVLVNGMPQFTAPPFPFFATFAPAGSARDFQFAVLADFGVVAKLTADVQTFASVAADAPAFAFVGGDFDHSNPQTLDAKRLMLKNLTIQRPPS